MMMKYFSDVITLLFLSPTHQAVLLDIINKNYDKIKKPRGDCKALIY